MSVGNTATGIGITMKSEFSGAVPEIPVKDGDKAAAYFEIKLGLHIRPFGDCLGK